MIDQATKDYETIAAALRHIEERALEQPSLEEVAGAVGLSPHHFHRLFRRWAGITPKRFLQLVTLEHAKRRLDESRPVLEATFGAGLSGPGRLHDLFVTVDGVTPGEYRNGGAGVEIAYGHADTPFGRALVARTNRGLCHLSFPDADDDTADPDAADSDAAAGAALAEEWPAARLRREDGAAADVVRRIFEGDRPPLDVQGTNFQVRVWEALVRIPEGTVACYSDVAEAVGRPDAVRAVAGAIAANRIAWLIPCHRVIRKLGETGGYRWGPTRKRAMLAWEAARAAG